MDTSAKNRTYPCKPATVDELFDVSYQASSGNLDACKALQKMIVDIPEEHIPWTSVHALFIFGNAYNRCAEALSKAHLQPGLYINHSGNCLFLIRLEDTVFQPCLDRLGSLLESLMLFNTELPSLDLSFTTSLQSLFANNNPALANINGLTELSQLVSLALINCPKLAQLPPMDNLTNLTHLNLVLCQSLTQLPPLDYQQNLTSMNLAGCVNLTNLPALNHLTKLTLLNFNVCATLTHIPPLDNLINLTSLNLSSCQKITQLPSLEHLANLTSLNLSHCYKLTQLPSLEHLTNLTTLDLSHCYGLHELPSLDGLSNLAVLNCADCFAPTQLPSLDSLTNLAVLNLSDCINLTYLPSLDNQTNLIELNLTHCRNLSQLPALDHLTNLAKLNLSDCANLTELPPLDHLTSLAELNFTRCKKLRTLPDDLRNLKSLRKLNLSFMRLQDLPNWLMEIGGDFSHRKRSRRKNTSSKAIVNLHNTTVDAIPDMSIFDQPYEVVAEWFKNRSLGKTRPLNEIKVVFLGDGEAGKSHTIARLMGDGGDPVDYTDKSTPGIVIKHKPYTHDGRDFRVHYWDFGGQEIMHSMHRIFLTSRTMYVVLLNARDDTQGDRAHYWLQNIQSFAPGAPVLLVLNKIDQNPKASVDERTLRAKYPGLTQVIPMSALNFSQEQFNREFRDILLNEIVKTRYLEAQWPGSWIQVKERLETMKSHFILGDEYRQICRECQLDHVEMGMLQYFNELGVSFCFCDEEDYELEDHVILRPDWITNGLYIILFNQLADAKNGLIPHKSIYRLLRSAHCSPDIRCTLPHAKYDNSDIHYVLGVMRKFDLSFTDGNKNEFIPMLCQQESTVDITELEQDDQVLEFNMEFEYLPENLLHRLMVERHEELDMESAWRRGARFRVDSLGYSAVVLIDVNNTLRFFIRHTDPMHRPNTYLTVLKANVDRIVEKMGLKPPINQLVYKLEGKIGTFDYEELRQAREDHEVSVYSRTWRRRIQIDDILNQSAPDDMEKEMRLLADIRRSCQHIQGEPSYYLTDNGQGLEDLRNRRIRDDLHGWSYHIQDQTQRGRSGGGKGIGELDLLLFNENLEPWTAIEALRVSDGAKAPWNKHLDKLLDNYNYFGASFLYLLTYVDADAKRFADIWKGYQTHIPKYASGRYTCIDNTFLELKRDSSQAFKAARCLYTCGDKPITVYHLFARIPLPNE